MIHKNCQLSHLHILIHIRHRQAYVTLLTETKLLLWFHGKGFQLNFYHIKTVAYNFYSPRCNHIFITCSKWSNMSVVSIMPSQIGFKQQVVRAFFWIIPWCLNFTCRRFRILSASEMEQTECFEMLAYKIQTLGNYQDESVNNILSFLGRNTMLIPTSFGR